MAESLPSRKASWAGPLRIVLLLISVPLLVHYALLSRPHKDARFEESEPTYQSHQYRAATQESSGNVTVWEVLKSEPRVSRFVEVVAKLPAAVEALSSPEQPFTVYAPVNEAFDSYYVAPDPPPFLGAVMTDFHRGPGVVLPKDLASLSTAPAAATGDLFLRYQQRISIHRDGQGKTTINHAAKVLPADESSHTAVNGYVHLIDTVMEVPNSTTVAVRTRPELSTFHDGVLRTGLRDAIYDTNLHFSHSVFAPTNTAFNKLGRRATSFLLGDKGRPLLKALLQYHVVANKTIFSDIYWPHGGAKEFNLPTLYSKANLTVVSERRSDGRWHLGAKASDDGKRVDVTDADIVTMDGVVHLVDSLIWPPGLSPKNIDQRSSLKRMWSRMWARDDDLHELLERLKPMMEE